MQEPGDIRLDPMSIRGPDEQPLDEAGEKLVHRAYSLFEQFRDDTREMHDEMKSAREMRTLSQAYRSRTSPLSNTLNSCIDNVIADQIDNTPEAKMVPEREETAATAEEMSDIVAYVLYQSNFGNTYRQIMEDSVVTGTGIAEVFWDDDLDDGGGMVSVSAWHPEDFYPDPMYENIQDGRACFKVTQTTVAWVEEHYPDAKGYVKADTESQDNVDTSITAPDGDHRTTLIEYWYRRYDAKKRKYRVHMAQLAGRALLYSTELGIGCSKNEYRQGVYAHGRYPFVMYRYRTVFRSPFGTGLAHDYAETQHTIDRYLKYIDDNARQSSRQRMFIRKGSGVNADEVADMSRDIIEWEGNNIAEVMQTIQAAPLNGQVYNAMQYLVDTMKQDCGQSQFNRGEGGLGVTAASAIESLQEAGGKIGRMHTESYKNSFRDMVDQIMWVLSEYLDADRKFRIVGGWDGSGNMKDRIVELHGTKKEGDAMPKPAYTVRVQVQKNNPLQIQLDNEFVTQTAQVCAQYGQPLPPESVIGLLEGYRTKESVLKAVIQNSQIRAQIEQMQQQIEMLTQKNQALQSVVDTDNRAFAKMGMTPGSTKPSGEPQGANAPDYSVLGKSTEE